MSETFTFTRMRFPVQADAHLRTLAGRTQLRPNILCRIALCLSLEAKIPYNPSQYSDWSNREINRGTLLGNIEKEVLNILAFWRDSNGVEDSLDDLCFEHIQRGLELLYRNSGGRKGVSLLNDLLP